MKLIKFCNFFILTCFIGLLSLLIPNYNFLKNELHDLLYKEGFKVEEIHINELEFLQVEEQIGKLTFGQGDYIFALELKESQQILEDNFWVEAAQLKIIYPNIVAVTLKEKQPKFLWYQDGQYHAIDALGKIIKTLTIAELELFANFIVVSGALAQQYIPNLLSFIASDARLKSYISEARFIGERRWDILFVNGLLVKLPQQNPQAAWAKFIELNETNNFLNNQFKSVDLRVEDKLFIEVVEPSPTGH